MTILITGVAGFIGYHTANKLLKKNYKIIGIDNLNSYYDKNLKINRLKNLNKNSNNKNFIFHKTDICNKKKLESLFKKYKIKKVLHFAAQAGIRFSLKKPEQYIQSNLLGFFNVLSLCKEYKVVHFVYASSSSVYGANTKLPFKESDGANHPIQLYAATKRSNELMAHSYSALYNLPTTGLRFFTVYGPWGRPDMALYKFVKNIFAGKKIEIYNNGKHIRDFTYIDDVINAVIKIQNKIPKKRNIIIKDQNSSESFAPFRIVNIGSNTPINLISYIKEIEKIIGKTAKKKFLSLQKGDILKTHSDISKIKKMVNYKSKTSIKKGLSKFIDWYVHYSKFKK